MSQLVTFVFMENLRCSPRVCVCIWTSKWLCDCLLAEAHFCGSEYFWWSVCAFQFVIAGDSCSGHIGSFFFFLFMSWCARSRACWTQRAMLLPTVTFLAVARSWLLCCSGLSVSVFPAFKQIARNLWVEMRWDKMAWEWDAEQIEWDG